MEKVMVSVIAVNHNTSDLLKECLASIVSAVGNESFEMWAIDSGSREEEARKLLTLTGDNVKVILNRENIGYARAVNAGVGNAKGDLVLITNPDVLYMPDSIRIMADALRECLRCGAVGPKTWWNREMTFLLPFSEPVTPYSLLRTELMRVSRTMGKVIQKRWIKKALGYWLSEKPIGQRMLSGACIMTTRKVLDEIGGFDDSFPLYFEDTDWSLRVRKAGYHLSMVPQANVIHYYNQSAKQDRNASQKKFENSQNMYMRKHYKSDLYLLRQMLRACSDRNKSSAVFEDFGTLTSPPVFAFRGSSKKVLLLSPLESLIPCAGAFFEVDSFVVPKSLWDFLAEERYFAKAVDVQTLKECGAWSWIKQVPA